MKLKFLLHLLWVAVVTGCVGQLPEEPPTTDRSSDEQAVDTLLEHATYEDAKSADFQLQAGQIALSKQDFNRVHSILASLRDMMLSAGDAIRFRELQAGLAVAQGSPEQAIKLMQPYDDLSPLTNKQRIRWFQLLAQAYYDNRQYYSSATTLIKINKLFQYEDQLNNHERIWQSLNELSMSTLWGLAKRTEDGEIRGWLSLASLAKRYSDSPSRQLAELNKWRQIWTHHPASDSLPTSLRMLAGIISNQAKHIAVLLPLSGEMARLGRAIRDGLLSAHYANLEPDQSYPQIRFYDSSTGNIQSLYDRVVEEGAEFIIGPLDRDRVTQFHALNPQMVPALVLNRSYAGNPSVAEKSELFYQFALSPEDEVLQVAEQAWQDGMKRVLMLAPDDDWGIRNGTVFRDSWLSLGGTIVQEQYFSTQRDYSKLVQTLLDIDHSKQRASSLKRIIGKRFEFTPRRRRDIDFIFLLANPSQAKGINPTLAFFYADDLPVYATSHVYDNSDTALDTIDLNGVRFCDVPFKLTDRSNLHSEINQLWQDATGVLAPFYALGIDAYRLYPRLNLLQQLPNEKIFGTTGVLSLNRDGTIRRKLTWAQVKNGEVLPIPIISQGSPF